jgi:hypothetical protein
MSAEQREVDASMPLRFQDGDVVVSAQGGVGNQLFQWAYAQQLAHEGRRVVIDSVRCRGDRPFVIGPLLGADETLARATGLLLAVADRAGAVRAVAGLSPALEPSGGGYHAAFRGSVPTRAYLRGYFQSEAYFSDVEERVRAAIMTFVDSLLTRRGMDLARELREDPATVAVHIRRGDYVSDAQAASVHGTLGEDYYARAIDEARARGGSRLVWFSDDLEWVRRTLARPGDLIRPDDVAHKDAGEIALIASCRHRIIANSSFSWWGGWLTDDAWPSVIAPAQWFRGAPEPDGLVPERWTRL